MTGEESRRRVHELRARSDAVAVGMGTVRADGPRLDARGVEAVRQPRRLVVRPRPAARRLGARAAHGPARRGARAARLRGRPVAAAGGWPDACRRRSSPRISSTSCSCSLRRPCRQRGPRMLGELPAAHAVAPDSRERRPRCSSERLCPRTLNHVPRASHPPSPEDEIVSALSHWLAFHLGNDELRARLSDDRHRRSLAAEHAEAVEELLAELEDAPEGERGELEMLVRETLEVVALG